MSVWKKVASAAAGGGVSYLAATSTSSPYVTLLEVTSGGSIALATTYTTNAAAYGIDFSHDNSYLAVTTSSSPYLTMLDHTTAGSLSLASTYTLSSPPDTDNGAGVAFSPDSAYLALAYGTPASRNFTGASVLLSHSAGSLTFADDGSFTSATNGSGVSFHPSGDYIAFGLGRAENTPSGTAYTGYFVLLDHTTPGTLTTADTYETYPGALNDSTRQSNDVSFAPSGDYVIYSGDSTPEFILMNVSTPGSVSVAATYNGASAAGVAFTKTSDDYIALARGATSSSNVTIMDHTTPGTMSVATTYTTSGTVNDVDFSSDDAFVCAVGDSSPYLTLLSFSGGSLTLAATYVLSGSGRGVAFSKA